MALLATLESDNPTFGTAHHPLLPGAEEGCIENTPRSTQRDRESCVCALPACPCPLHSMPLPRTRHVQCSLSLPHTVNGHGRQSTCAAAYKACAMRSPCLTPWMATAERAHAQLCGHPQLAVQDTPPCAAAHDPLSTLSAARSAAGAPAPPRQLHTTRLVAHSLRHGARSPIGRH